MTTFLLIRHAAHDLLGRTLAGRMADVHLNAHGKVQAREVAGRLSNIPIRALYTSPLERCQETARPIAERFGLPLDVHSALDEVDCGRWTGKNFPDLNPDPAWHRWNSERENARCPDGESMRQVQERIVRAMTELHTRHDDMHVALISHGDVIRAALMHYLGMPLDYILRFEISPASVSIVTLSGPYSHVTLVNDTGAFAGPVSA